MAKHLEQTAEKGEPILREERVLVVDDLKKWHRDATNNLLYYGCEEGNIFRAYDIREGEGIYIAKKPSMVLADINFDIMDKGDTQGLEFIQWLRKERFSNPLIAMSSLTDVGARALKVGADYFIQKGKQFTERFDEFVEWYKQR